MSLFSIDINCLNCGYKWDDLVPRDVAAEPGSRFFCPECEEPAGERAISSPNSTKASFVDGHRRKGWDKLKEAASLNKQRAVAREDTKKELTKEIRKLGVGVEK